jgi:hypothetical protein
MTGPSMPGHHCTTDEYALQQKVESFSNLIFQFEEHHLTHIYHVIFRFCEKKGIRYLVLRYLNTSA